MLFQIYGETAAFQLLGWLMVFVGLILANEFARRTKWGGIACCLVLPAVLTVYFISIYVGAAMGAEWALNNPTYVYMNGWFHYFKLYAATLGCIGFMMIKYKWSIGKTDWFKVYPFLIVAANILIAVVSDFESGNEGSPVTGWLWIVLAVLVLLAWGIQGFFMKFANESMDAESLFVYMALFAVVLAPVAYFMTPDAATFFAQEGAMTPFWSSFGIQILNSIGALTLVYAYRHGKAVVVSPMEGLAPMVTVLLSLVILHVIPNPLQIAGLVCAGFAMYALSK